MNAKTKDVSVINLNTCFHLMSIYISVSWQPVTIVLCVCFRFYNNWQIYVIVIESRFAFVYRPQIQNRDILRKVRPSNTFFCRFPFIPPGFEIVHTFDCSPKVANRLTQLENWHLIFIALGRCAVNYSVCSHFKFFGFPFVVIKTVGIRW